MQTNFPVITELCEKVLAQVFLCFTDERLWNLRLERSPRLLTIPLNPEWTKKIDVNILFQALSPVSKGVWKVTS